MKRSPVRKKRPGPLRRGRVLDQAFITWMHDNHYCLVVGVRCYGRATVHHVRKSGSLKDDRRVLMLCEGHHLHDFGPESIERLGKNLIGLRTALMRESIFPFVCFGYGCDFDDGSSILDRVTTMAMFGYLNKTYLHNQESGRFNRGSFYFRCDPWTVEEMATVMKDIAERSVQYYFSKYKESHFVR